MNFNKLFTTSFDVVLTVVAEIVQKCQKQYVGFFMFQTSHHRIKDSQIIKKKKKLKQ